jgi:hypothetical protein
MGKHGSAAGPPPVPSGEGRGWPARRRHALHGNDALPKMAADWGGGFCNSASGPGPTRWSWSGSLWVQGILLLLGGLPASAASVSVALSSSPPCRHHVPSDSEVLPRRGGSRPCEGKVICRVSCGSMERGTDRTFPGLGPAVSPCTHPTEWPGWALGIVTSPCLVGILGQCCSNLSVHLLVKAGCRPAPRLSDTVGLAWIRTTGTSTTGPKIWEEIVRRARQALEG